MCARRSSGLLLGLVVGGARSRGPGGRRHWIWRLVGRGWPRRFARARGAGEPSNRRRQPHRSGARAMIKLAPLALLLAACGTAPAPGELHFTAPVSLGLATDDCVTNAFSELTEI